MSILRDISISLICICGQPVHSPPCPSANLPESAAAPPRPVDIQNVPRLNSLPLLENIRDHLEEEDSELEFDESDEESDGWEDADEVDLPFPPHQ